MSLTTYAGGSRQGKRRPGTVLINYPAPVAVRNSLKAIAEERGEPSLSVLLRKISSDFIRRYYAAKRRRSGGSK